MYAFRQLRKKNAVTNSSLVLSSFHSSYSLLRLPSPCLLRLSKMLSTVWWRLKRLLAGSTFSLQLPWHLTGSTAIIPELHRCTTVDRLRDIKKPERCTPNLCWLMQWFLFQSDDYDDAPCEKAQEKSACENRIRWELSQGNMEKHLTHDVCFCYFHFKLS